MTQTLRAGLDQPVLYPAEKVLRVSLGFFGSAGITAVLKHYFLQGNLDCILRLKPPRHQFSGSRGETLGVGPEVRLAVRGAVMVLESGRGQPVVGAFCFLIGKQGWNWKSPATLRTGPAGQALVRYPCKPSAHGFPTSRNQVWMPGPNSTPYL